MYRLYNCEDCGLDTEFFRIKDETWLQIATARTLLCLDCCELRLKLPLTIDDFDLDMPINRMIRAGYALAKRENKNVN
jgi:hypothetical protein